MLAVFGILVVAAVAVGLFLILTLIAGIAKLAFKLVLIPIAAIAGLVVLCVIGPVLLAVGVLLLPLLLIGGLLWAGLHVVAAI